MKKRQIILELTPLLDVILILLFVLLTQSRAQVAASAERADQAERTAGALQETLAETREALSAAERRERTLGIVEERSVLLTLSVQEGPVRRILAEDAAGNAAYVRLDASRAEDAGARLRALLREKLLAPGEETAFLVFQYDRNALYHAEYDLISGVLRDLKPELQREGVYLNIAELDIGSTEES